MRDGESHVTVGYISVLGCVTRDGCITYQCIKVRNA